MSSGAVNVLSQGSAFDRGLDILLQAEGFAEIGVGGELLFEGGLFLCGELAGEISFYFFYYFEFGSHG
jgi:hypothetical protein